mgnify:CR=1 FL=1
MVASCQETPTTGKFGVSRNLSSSLCKKGNDGFTVFEANGVYGLSVSGQYGFVGINDRTPFVSLDVVDNLTATNGSGQIRLSTLDSGRKIAFSLSVGLCIWFISFSPTHFIPLKQ